MIISQVSYRTNGPLVYFSLCLVSSIVGTKQKMSVKMRLNLCNKTFTPSKHVREMYTPLNSTFIVKLGYTGVNLFLLSLLQNIDCGYSLEPPREAVQTCTHNLCFAQKYEKYQKIFQRNFQFLQLKKIPRILHGQVKTVYLLFV